MDTANTDSVIQTYVVPALAELKREVTAIREIVTSTRKPILTVEEFADLVGRSPYTVRRWVTEGRIKATRANGSGPRGRLLIHREELDAILADGLGKNIGGVA